MVELEEVQDLDHAEEEGPCEELVPDVEEDVGVVRRDEEESEVESHRHRPEEDDDRLEESHARPLSHRGELRQQEAGHPD